MAVFEPKLKRLKQHNRMASYDLSWTYV